ncbi:MAG: type II toxin-antitoxin system VapC family toxin [Gammaproteobacteria bacterium]
MVSSVTVVETRMVVHARRGQRAVVLVDDLLRLPLLYKGADFAGTDIARAVGDP